MDKPIIEVANLSKLYRLGSIDAGTFRDSFTHWWGRMKGKDTSSVKKASNYTPSQAGREANSFWALEDISFAARRGEVVGLVGRNGAGKSTLLKILSRITEPTRGRAVVRGRAAALLEIGTGFHPDLTGRENVFLNGSLLGMRVGEIRRKFDEILDFAGVEQFIDTPVKRYSSGMYVRLAFAVAAHLEPDVLFVDEVLAVGDTEFQKKCLGKMEGVAKHGRTVFFVSHNMVAVSQLCQECIWLDKGRLVQKGPAVDVITAYMQSGASGEHNAFDARSVAGTGQVQLLSYNVVNARGARSPLPHSQEDLAVHIRLRVQEAVRQFTFGVEIWNQMGTLLTSITAREQGISLAPLPAGEHEVIVRLGQVPYLPGMFRMSFWVQDAHDHMLARTESGISFEIAQSPLYGTTHVDYRNGAVYTDISYEVRGA